MNQLCKKCGKISTLNHDWIIDGKKPDPCIVISTDIPGRWTRHANADRSYYAADLLQPIKNGAINKDFVKVHGTKELQKQWKMSDKKIREHADL